MRPGRKLPRLVTCFFHVHGIVGERVRPRRLTRAPPPTPTRCRPTTLSRQASNSSPFPRTGKCKGPLGSWANCLIFESKADCLAYKPFKGHLEIFILTFHFMSVSGYVRNGTRQGSRYCLDQSRPIQRTRARSACFGRFQGLALETRGWQTLQCGPGWFQQSIRASTGISRWNNSEWSIGKSSLHKYVLDAKGRYIARLPWIVLGARE